SSSANGVSWSAVKRIPIDSVTSGADHFIPGLAVDKAPARIGHLALTYYFYPDATCNGGCQLDTAYISSPDGRNHSGSTTPLARRNRAGRAAAVDQTQLAPGQKPTLQAVVQGPRVSAPPRPAGLRPPRLRAALCAAHAATRCLAESSSSIRMPSSSRVRSWSV